LPTKTAKEMPWKLDEATSTEEGSPVECLVHALEEAQFIAKMMVRRIARYQGIFEENTSLTAPVVYMGFFMNSTVIFRARYN
jgi:hypothetical protein